MKRIILGFIAMMLITSLIAQHQNSDLFKQVVKQKKANYLLDLKINNYIYQVKNKQEIKMLYTQKAVKQKMDSAVLVEDGIPSKVDFFYNNNGENISQITYTYSEDSAWVKSKKTEYNYTQAGEINTETVYEWINGVQWIESQKIEYTYNANNNIVLIQTFTWYNAIGEWILKSEENHYYDANQNDTLYTISDYKEYYDTLIYYSKEEKSYDINNNNISMKYFEFDTMYMEWKGVFKMETNYNQNNISDIMVYLWDTVASDWSILEKIEYLYNIHGNDSLQFTYMWFSTDWMELMKVKYVYDANLNYKTITTYMSDFMGGWENYYKFEYSVNTAYSSNNILLPNNIDFSQQVFSNEVTQILYYIYSEDWILSSQKDYYYSQAIVSIVEPNTLEVTLYPNPSKGNINIVTDKLNNATMQIYNNLGQIVMQQNLRENTTQINISNLQSGIYFVTIKTNDGMVTKKIIKQ